MQATLIYNPNARATQTITPEEILQALLQAGYEPVYLATDSEQDLDQVLKEIEGLVVVAGGDGSVRAVVTRLVDHHVPVSILPLGTANNIANALGITGTPQEIIAGLAAPQPCNFDIGVVHFPWGKCFFLEAFGFGLYADGLAYYEPEKGKSVLRSIAAAIQAITGHSPRHYRLLLDGEDISGDYLMVEALNTQAFGPRIRAAPDADPSDGQLDMMRLREGERESLVQYLLAVLNGEVEQLDNVDVRRGRLLEVSWNGFCLHLDAEVVFPPDAPPGEREAGKSETPEIMLRVEMMPKALELWLPGPGPDAANPTQTGGEA